MKQEIKIITNRNLTTLEQQANEILSKGDGWYIHSYNLSSTDEYDYHYVLLIRKLPEDK